MAVVRSPEPSMPTPTIPKRTRSLAATACGDANSRLKSRKTEFTARVASAAPAVVCKNSRREKRFLFIAISLGASHCIHITLMFCSFYETCRYVEYYSSDDGGKRQHLNRSGACTGLPSLRANFGVKCARVNTACESVMANNTTGPDRSATVYGRCGSIGSRRIVGVVPTSLRSPGRRARLVIRVCHIRLSRGLEKSMLADVSYRCLRHAHSLRVSWTRT